MKYKNLFYFTAVLFLLINKGSLSQSFDVKWGEIPRVDLKMTHYPADTNASALILYHLGDVSLNDELNLHHTEHLRIKIFTPKGYDLATHSIRVNTNSNERLIDLEAFTYWFDDNGKIVKTELDDDDIFKEKVVGGIYDYKFTMPSLKPGCVFEIRYSIEIPSIYRIKDWIFQWTEPVSWSEYRITMPHQINYSAVTRGFEMWAVNETNEAQQVFRGNAANYVGKSIVKCYQFRWAVENAPAIRDAPFISTREDYVNKVDVQLNGFSFNNGAREQVLESWEKLTEKLIDNKNFGERIENNRTVRKIAEQLTSGLTLPEDKVKAIYNWIAKTIVFTGNELFTDEDSEDVIENKKGSSADITFLLLSMLKSVGIEGQPIILSTRANGKIQELYPIVSQFNYVIARVKIDNKIYYLDATNPNRPYDMLPFKVLGAKGLVVQPGKQEWVTFQSDKKNSNTSLIIANIDQDGAITANFEELYTGYTALNTRDELTSKKEVEIAKDIFKTDASGFVIDSVLITNRDSIDVPLKIKAWVKSESFALKNGDMIYVNPYMIQRTIENPFKADVRKYPVDYGYKSNTTTITNITIPDGYEVKEMLANKNIVLGGHLTFSRVSQVDSNAIQVITKFVRNVIELKPNLYSHLKRFYTDIIAAQSEQIVLSLKQESQKSTAKKSADNK